MSYDSGEETRAHIAQVQRLLGQVIDNLRQRAAEHDLSKLREPEKAVFDQFTPMLRDSIYGSPEYRAGLERMGPALRHHYAANDHHPEHGDGTLDWMHLVQLLELLADWKAATLRGVDGDLRRSIRHNATRFGYGVDIERLLLNTAASFGWLTGR